MATNFKLKSSKTKYAVTINTIDGSHKKIKQKFERDLNILKKKREKLDSIKQQLETNPDNKKQLKNTMYSLQKSINEMSNNPDEIEYFYDTSDILNDYYENTKIAQVDAEVKLKPKKAQSDTVLINKKKQGKKLKNVPKKRYNKSAHKSQNIMDLLMKTKSTTQEKEPNDTTHKNKAQLLDDFLTITDPIYVSRTRHKYNPHMMCEDCNVLKSMIPAEGICVCKECGKAESIILDSDRPNYKECNPEKAGYPYKRINHFNEWLSLFQAKESTDIPNEVYEAIINKMKQMRIIKKNRIKIKIIKQIMKQLKLTQYYEHIPHIISKLTGVPPPTISRETEAKLRDMFKEIQKPFERHRPRDRINFLSYSYVLHKFCQLLELDDFIKCFPLLKSGEKLRQYDRIWKKICADLNWAFYRSI